MLDLLESSARMRVQSIPRLHAFYQDAHHVLSRDPDAFNTLLDSFKNLAQPPFLPELINHELRTMGRDNLYLPDLTGEFQLTLFRTDFCGLDLRLVPVGYAPSSILLSLTEDFMVAALHGEKIQAQCFFQSEPFPYDQLSPDRTLQAGPYHSLDKEVLSLRAGYDLFSLEAVSQPAVLLLFSSALKIPIRWEYEHATGRPLRMLAASPVSSRIQFACRALAHLEYTEAAETVAALVEHPDHHIRWTSVTTLIDLDFPQGLKALQSCLNDAHPHIQQAARESLASLQEGQETN